MHRSFPIKAFPIKAFPIKAFPITTGGKPDTPPHSFARHMVVRAGLRHRRASTNHGRAFTNYDVGSYNRIMRTSLVILAGWVLTATISVQLAADEQPAAPRSAIDPPQLELPAGWPLMRGDAQATGVAPGKLPDRLNIVWRMRVPKSSFAATAIIADGVVFVGDLDGTLYALDLKDGLEKWRYQIEGSFHAAAAVRAAIVFAPDGQGRLHALDAVTGRRRWVYETESGAEINSSPTFYKGNVLFGSQDATLYCLDIETGREVWTHAIDDQIRSTPTIAGNRTFLAGCDSKLHVVDLDTGKGVAAVDIRDQTGSTPAVLGDLVYFGTEGGSFFAIDWKKAEVVWTYRDEVHMLPYRSSAAVTREAIVFGGRDKFVRAVSPATGDPIWEFATRGRVDGSPIIAGQRVYIGSADGRFYVLDRASGALVWQVETGGRFSASPAAADGRIVIGNEDGVLYCLGE
jgi:outer membrane protein assembly factor BamB